MIKDLCRARGLRHDIFVRGVNRLAGPDLLEFLREITLALSVNAAEFSFDIEMAKGAARLSKEFYAPVVAALAKQPQKVGSLMSFAPPEGNAHDPAEVIGILVGTGQALPMLHPGAPLSTEAKALNRVIVAAFGRLDHRGPALALASTALGAGLPAGPIDLFVQRRLSLGEDDRALAAWVSDFGAKLDPKAAEQLRARLQALCRAALFFLLRAWRSGLSSPGAASEPQPRETETGQQHHPGSRLRHGNDVCDNLIVEGLHPSDERRNFGRW